MKYACINELINELLTFANLVKTNMNKIVKVICVIMITILIAIFTLRFNAFL